jgi:glycyl-tRNA synthetase
LEGLAENWSDFEPVATALENDGKTILESFEITKEMVTWTKTAKKVHEIKFTPSVIEPSFGMGRILYSLLEHSFYQREQDEQRCVMKFNPIVAPEKCAVLPIVNNPQCNSLVDDIAKDLMDSDLATRVDKSSTSLGRRYARADELGVPFAVTVDFTTIVDDTVTLRERDSTIQVRLPVKEVTHLIFLIVHGKMTWEKIMEKYPVVQVSEDGENEEGNGAVTAAPTTSGGDFSATVIEANERGRFRRPAVPIL